MQASPHNQVRIGLPTKAKEHFWRAMPKLNSNVGLVVVDEGTEEWLTDHDHDSVSNVSTIPDERGTTTSVYVINFPPWYTKAVVTAI